MGDSVDQTTFMFDYNDLPNDSRLVVESCRDGIRSSARAAVVEIGRMLQVVHDELAKHGSGSFGEWLSLEFDFSRETAYRYMSVARHLSGLSAGLTIDAKALYVLAASSTPQEVRDEFIEKAEAGERVKKVDVLTRLGKTPVARPTKEPTLVEYTDPTPMSQPAPSIPADHKSGIDYDALPEVSKEFIRQFSRIDVEGNIKSAILKIVSRSIDNHNDMRRMNKEDLQEFTRKGGDLDKFLREVIDYNLEVVSWCRQALPDDEQKIRRLP
jgi:hypothetical protein